MPLPSLTDRKMWMCIPVTVFCILISFSALTLLVGWQEWHLACKNMSKFCSLFVFLATVSWCNMYVIGQAIIFSSWLRFLLSVFFRRLFSAVADWMSTIVAHMMWPYCEFRMQVWNVLHAARWKYRMQKSPKIHDLGTIAQLCRAVSSQLRHISTIAKKR